MALATAPQQNVAINYSTAGTSANITIANAPAGSILLMQLSAANVAQLFTPTNTATVQWEQLGIDLFGPALTQWFAGYVTGAGSGTTVNIASTVSFATYAAFGELHEIRGAFPRVYGFAQSNASSGAMTTPTQSPTTGRVAMVVGMGRNYGGGTIALSGSNPSNSFTDPNVTGSVHNRFAYRYEASTTGSYSTAWTFSTSANTTRCSFVLYEVALPAAAVTQQPTNTAPNTAISPVIMIEARTNGTSVDTGIGAGTNCVCTIYSGTGTLLGTTTRAFSAGVATFTGLGLATGTGTFRLQFAITGYVAAISATFYVGNIITLAVVTQPQCTQQGVFILPAIDIEHKLNGARDTSSSDVHTLSKVSGPGALTGSTLTATVGAAGTPGVSRFAAIKADTVGTYVLRVTSSTGETIDTVSVIIRDLAYATTGGWNTVNDIIESKNGQRMYSRLYIPSGATPGVPLPLSIRSSDGGNLGSNPNALISQPGLAYVATDNWLVLVVPRDNGFVQESSVCTAIVEFLARYLADGIAIDTQQIVFDAFSAAGKIATRFMYEFSNLLAGAVLADPQNESNTMTAAGAGPPLGAMAASKYDASGVDQAAAVEWATVVKNGRTSILCLHGNQVNTFNGRNICDMDLWFKSPYGMDALPGIAFEYTSGSNTNILVSAPTVKYAYQLFQVSAGVSHGPMEVLVDNATNHPIKLAWMNAQRRSVADGNIIFARLSARLQGNAERALTREARARIGAAPNSRPSFTFIH